MTGWLRYGHDRAGRPCDRSKEVDSDGMNRFALMIFSRFVLGTNTSDKLTKETKWRPNPTFVSSVFGFAPRVLSQSNAFVQLSPWVCVAPYRGLEPSKVSYVGLLFASERALKTVRKTEAMATATNAQWTTACHAKAIFLSLFFSCSERHQLGRGLIVRAQ